MVQRGYVECPTCGKLYQLKIQVDQNIRLYDWPICFECIDCGDILNFTYSKKGFFPKQSNYKPAPDDEPVTTIGYSSSLPVTDDIYMKELNYAESIVKFSPFMNLQYGHFSPEELHEFDIFLIQMQNNLLPFKGVFQALFPILKKGNVKAFSKKAALFFDIKDYKELSSAQDMFDYYFELLEKTYINLCPQAYSDNYHNKFIVPLGDWINKASKAEVKGLKDKLDESGKISLWYKEEALPYLARMINDVHKLIPSMIYSSVGESDLKRRGDLKTVTLSCKEATDYYKDGYEVFAKGLKILVGLNNIVENGSIDSFANPQLQSLAGITAFAQLKSGLMVNQLSDHTTISNYLDDAMNNRVRNAASHDGIEYDASNQQVHCHYDATDKTKVFETNLISISRMCYLQLLHIIEVTLLARKIVEKAK